MFGKLRIIFCLFFFLLSIMLMAQPFYFKENTQIPVSGADGSVLQNPWAGGFNACQLGMMDLNADDMKDLVVFDKTGNQVICFLYDTDKQAYFYAPEKANGFPVLKEWMILRDFDGDGKEDLFTSDGVAGISLYKHVSDMQGIRFILIEKTLKATMFQSVQPIYCPSIEYPALSDVDGDGDLDILTFWVPSADNYLHWYRNMSMEKYGHADSLIFDIADWSWGCFLENKANNEILLDTCAPQQSVSKPLPSKHTGSSVTVIDMDKDGVSDILLSDFGFPYVAFLHNDGTKEKAHINTVDMTFPSQSTPIEIFSCPTIQLLDVDHCGKDEMIVTSFAGTPFNMDGKNNIWLYQNKSATGVDFVLHQKDFLQEQTLDFGLGAYPALFDYNNDGLVDLVIGNYGLRDTVYEQYGDWKVVSTARLALLQNVGTADAPAFRLMDEDFANLSALHLTYAAPTFGDIDDDGKAEMLIGSEKGNLYFFKNKAPLGQYPDFELIDSNYQHIQAGAFAAPQWFDLNRDGLQDLIIGEQRNEWIEVSGKQKKGNLNYYENIGTKQKAVFTFITDSLGSVDVINHDESVNGYSIPFFYRDNQDKTWLFCGEEDGKVSLYENIDENPTGIFTKVKPLDYLSNNQSQPIHKGSYSAPCVYDFNHDGFPDLLLGNFRGGLSFFEGMASSGVPSVRPCSNISSEVKVYPNPVAQQLFVQTSVAVVHYEIVNINGKSMQKGKPNNSFFVIETDPLPTGFYMIKMYHDTGFLVTKFVRK